MTDAPMRARGPLGSSAYLALKVLQHPGRASRQLRARLRTWIAWDRLCAALPEPRREGPVEVDEAAAARIASALESMGLPVERRGVDRTAYHDYLARAEYRRHWLYLDGGRAPGFHEKGLEHFLAADLLGLSREDVYVDVASQESPVPEIYGRLFGCRTFAQDLAYPPGLRGRRIGGDAARMPVPDGFATAMALHNAFEHFEGDSDIGFVREAARVLRPGGRLCIIPLFLGPEHAIQTDPSALDRRVPCFDRGAVIHCARGWHDRFGRFYDPAALGSRLLANVAGLRLRLVEYVDAPGIDPACYLRFVALFERV